VQLNLNNFFIKKLFTLESFFRALNYSSVLKLEKGLFKIGVNPDKEIEWLDLGVSLVSEEPL
jgi:hypothetical protein